MMWSINQKLSLQVSLIFNTWYNKKDNHQDIKTNFHSDDGRRNRRGSGRGRGSYYDNDRRPYQNHNNEGSSFRQDPGSSPPTVHIGRQTQPNRGGGGSSGARGGRDGDSGYQGGRGFSGYGRGRGSGRPRSPRKDGQNRSNDGYNGPNRSSDGYNGPNRSNDGYNGPNRSHEGNKSVNRNTQGQNRGKDTSANVPQQATPAMQTPPQSAWLYLIVILIL